MRLTLYTLSLMMFFVIVGCHRSSDNDLLFTQNERPSECVFITTESMGFGHIAQTAEDIYGPFIFETEGTFVGIPTWTFSGELLDARLQPIPGVGTTVGGLVGAPVSTGTFFITATVIDTGNGCESTVTVPFTVVDCTPGFLGEPILDITPTAFTALATEGTPYVQELTVTGNLSENVVWQVTSPDPTVDFSFTGVASTNFFVMENHTAADSPITVVVTVIDNAPNPDELDENGFYEEIIGTGSGCSVSMTYTINVEGGTIVTPPTTTPPTGGGGGGAVTAAATDAGSGSAVPVSIPDGDLTGVSDTITVSDTGTITDLNVTVDITHTFIGDMAIAIGSPGSTIVTLASGNGGSADDMSVVFDDEATDSISTFAGGAGTFMPLTPLSNFDGESISGIWTIALIDYSTPDPGTLNNWILSFNS